MVERAAVTSWASRVDDACASLAGWVRGVQAEVPGRAAWVPITQELAQIDDMLDVKVVRISLLLHSLLALAPCRR